MATGISEDVSFGISNAPRELIDQIEAMAEAGRRSRSAQMILLLEEIVALKLKKEAKK